MTDVFISYARNDSDSVRVIYDALLAQKRSVWIDWHDIPLTAEWWKEITDGIEKSDNFVSMITPSSLASPVCNLEIDCARALNKRVIAILLMETDEKSAHVELVHRELNAFQQELLAGRDLLSIARDNWKVLAGLNWINFVSVAPFEQKFKDLIDALDTDIAYVHEHTRLLTRANEWYKRGKPATALLRGDELRQAEAWLANSGRKRPYPTELHSSYILASRQHAARRQKLITGIGAFVLILVSVLAIVSFLLYLQAERKAEEARSAALAAASQSALERNDTDRAIALALMANEIDDPAPIVQAALANAAYAPGTRSRWTASQFAIRQMAVSADGRYALTAAFTDDSPALTLWDVRRQAAICDLAGHTARIEDVVFAPQPGPWQAVSVAFDGGWIQWDLTQCAAEKTGTVDAELTSAALSEDGNTLYAGTSAGRIFRVDLASATLQGMFDSGHTDYVASLARVPYSDFVLSGSYDGTVIMWDAGAGRLVHQFTQHSDRVYDVDVSWNGRTALSASGDGSIILWDLTRWLNPETGADSDQLRANVDDQILRLYGHSGQVFSVRFSSRQNPLISGLAHGQLVALSASEDKSLIVWDLSTGTVRQRLLGHDAIANQAAFVPGTMMAISTDETGEMRLWDLESGNLLHQYTGHERGVRAVSYAPGDTFISGAEDMSLIQWNIQDGTRHQTFWHKEAVLAAELSPDQRLLLAGGERGTLMLWDVQTGDLVRTFSPGHIDYGVIDIAFLPDGKSALSASSDQTLIWWDVATGERIHTLSGHTSWVVSVAVDRTGTYALSGTTNGDVFLWDLRNPGQYRVWTQQTGSVRALRFSPSAATPSQWAVIGSGDGTMSLWDVEAGRMIRRYVGHTAQVMALDWSPDGQMLASGGRDNTIILWSVTDGLPLLRFTAHADAIRSVAFSADGRQLLSGSYDQRVRLWQLYHKPDDIRAWLDQNRYIRVLTSEEYR